MQKIELPEITSSVRQEYQTLVESIAISVGVTPENISELLKISNQEEFRPLVRGKPVSIKLSVGKEFPISWDSQKPGRVFELSGQSDRNKTTSLIYLATLLGIDWFETRPFLDRDDRVFNTATQKVYPALSRDQQAEVHLESKGYNLSITTAGGKAIISLLNENSLPLPDFDSRVVPLATPQDWEKYRELMSQICDVQFVSKSRDFIGQVSIEESKYLSQFCRDIAHRASLMLGFLQTLPIDQIYGRSEKNITEEISSLNNSLNKLRREISEINEKIVFFENLIQGRQKLIAVYRELEDTQSSDLKEVLKCLRLAEMVRDQDQRRAFLYQIIQEARNELDRARKQLEQQEPILTTITQSLEALSGKIGSELKNLTVLSGQASLLFRAIANKDYSQLLTFCSYGRIDKETVFLLEEILEVTGRFSKGLIVPLKSSERSEIKLFDLEKDLANAKSIASDVQRLNPELKAAYDAFNNASALTLQDVRRLELSVDTAQAMVKDKERILSEMQKELKLINETILSTLGSEDLQTLKEKAEYLRSSLPDEQRGLLDRVEMLARDMELKDSWQFNPSEIQIEIKNCYNRIEVLDKDKLDKDATLLDLNKRLLELKQITPRHESGRVQIDALGDLQGILLLIKNYFDNYVKVREMGRESRAKYEFAQLDHIKEQLEQCWDDVRQTINHVIRERCPVMYKNRKSGVIRLPVLDYDFLNGQQVVKALEVGEWAGGGGDSAMTVYGLATRSSDSYLGTVLLVDEFNDAETFKSIVCDDLAKLDQLAFAIFVRQNPSATTASFEVLK